MTTARTAKPMRPVRSLPEQINALQRALDREREISADWKTQAGQSAESAAAARTVQDKYDTLLGDIAKRIVEELRDAKYIQIDPKRTDHHD